MTDEELKELADARAEVRQANDRLYDAAKVERLRIVEMCERRKRELERLRLNHESEREQELGNLIDVLRDDGSTL